MRELFPDNIFVPPAWGEGKRLVVAEAPGETETQTGIPLTGGAGKWFDVCIKKAGLRREDLTLTNIIQCRPPANVFPTDPDAKSYISPKDGEASVQHCLKHHVEPVLHDRQWERIDLLGAKPLEYIAGKRDGIFKWRGAPLVISELSPRPLAIATLHPAYLARDQVMLPVVINDLRKSLIPPPENYNTSPSLEQVQAFRSVVFAYDIETAYWWGDASKILCVGLCDRPYHGIVVPFKPPYIAELKRIFRNAKIYITQNGIQFDQPQLEAKGIEFNPEADHYDTMLLHHLKFPDLPHALDDLGSFFTNKGVWKDKKKENLELYCARDTDVTMQCYKQLRPMVENAGLMDLYKYVQVPLAKICKLMSDTGFKVNPNRIGEVREKITAEILREEQHLPEQLRTRTIQVGRRENAPVGTLGKSGKPVKYITRQVDEVERPWGSPTVIGKWLHEELGLAPIADLKTGKPSTGKIALDKHYNKTKNRSIKAVKNLKKMNSLLTLFCKEEMLRVGTIHTHFNVHGTASGRLSSSDPNLQNVTEAARFIYIPHHEGWSIIDVDYSGIENRLTAHFANDVERMQRFLTIPDYSEHKHAVTTFFGIPYDEVEKDNDKDAPYGKAKRIVHGSNYGMGAKKISQMYDMDFAEIKELLNKWKSALKTTVAWQNRLTEQAKKEGYLSTPFGRKRWFYTTSYYTESLSFLPQSTAADVIFRAMLGCMYERIGWPLGLVSKVVGYVEPLPRPANLLIQVHDSLVVECPDEMIPQVVGVLKRVMEQPFKELGGLTLPIGIAVGKSWGETEKYTGPVL